METPSKISYFMENSALFLFTFVALALPLFAGSGIEYFWKNVFITMTLLAIVLWMAGQYLRGKPPLVYHNIIMPVIAFFVFVFISTALTGFYRPSTKAALEMASFAFLFVLAWNIARDKTHFRFVLSIIIASAMVTVFYGVYQYFVGIPNLIQYIESTPKEEVISQLSVWGHFTESSYPDFLSRVYSRDLSGPFILSNSFAGFLTIVIPIMAGLFLDTFKIIRDRYKYLILSIIGIFVAAAILVIILTKSVGGWVSFLFSTVFFVLLAVFAYRERMLKAVKIGFVCLLLFLIIFPPVYLSGKRYDYTPLSTLTIRSGYWNGAFEIAKSYPWFGVGPRRFHEFYLQVKKPYNHEAEQPHNMFLKILSEMGIFAFVAMAAFWVMVIGLVIRGKRPAETDAEEPAKKKRTKKGKSPPQKESSVDNKLLVIGILAGISAFIFLARIMKVYPWFDSQNPISFMPVVLGIVWLAIFWFIFRSAKYETYAYILLGIVAGLFGFLLHSTVDIDFSVPGILTVVALGLGLLMAAMTKKHAPPQNAKRIKNIGLVALAAGAILFMLYALFVAPAFSNSEALYQVGKSYERQSDINEAQKFYQESIAEDPRYIPPRIALAKIYYDKQLSQQTIEELQQVVNINDRYIDAYLMLHTVYTGEQQYEDALNALREAVALYPTNPKFQMKLGDYIFDLVSNNKRKWGHLELEGRKAYEEVLSLADYPDKHFNEYTRQELRKFPLKDLSRLVQQSHLIPSKVDLNRIKERLKMDTWL